MLHYCIKRTLKTKFNVKYLHKGHKININFVIMILHYPHLRHKMSNSLFGWFVQYPNVGHKMKKMMMIKKKRLEEINKL